MHVGDENRNYVLIAQTDASTDYLSIQKLEFHILRIFYELIWAAIRYTSSDRGIDAFFIQTQHEQPYSDHNWPYYTYSLILGRLQGTTLLLRGQKSNCVLFTNSQATREFKAATILVVVG